MARFCVVVALAAALAGCGGSGAHAPASPSPAPSRAAPTVPLHATAFLTIRVQLPAGWRAHRTIDSSTSGNATYTAPDRRGMVYLEVNDCAACVDAGLVRHGHRNGQPDPRNAVKNYLPVTQRRVSPAEIAFTTSATTAYAADGRLIVTRANGTVTGYVVVIVTLPTEQRALSQRILASLRLTRP